MAVQIRPTQVQPGDEDDVLQTIGGEAVWAPAPAPDVPLTAGDLTTRWQPAVMVVGGVPELVYDSFDQLVMVEVPNP